MFDYVTSNFQNDLVFYLWHRYLSLGLILSLPQFWVNPFSHTGANFMGSFFLRNVFQNKDEKLYKVLTVVYTCASSRAIRLDMVPDASCSSFVRSLKHSFLQMVCLIFILVIMIIFQRYQLAGVIY